MCKGGVRALGRVWRRALPLAKSTLASPANSKAIPRCITRFARWKSIDEAQLRLPHPMAAALPHKGAVRLVPFERSHSLRRSTCTADGYRPT